ncbi:unnamed protein product [Echinostoma caproni]|uniref:Uncharacterized protein n=1 Tax=Echinostoma caproni TaxID=27848 RepID=A0A183B848_9TREM|nr:unnamed protein product [Echinostoma caproni]
MSFGQGQTSKVPNTPRCPVEPVTIAHNRKGNRAALIFQTDPVDTPPVAAADKSSVPVWATGGRLQLSIEDYIDCAMVAHPNGFQAPTDNDTSILSPNVLGRKRCWNSVMRTCRYLEIVLESRRKNSVSPRRSFSPLWFE